MGSLRFFIDLSHPVALWVGGEGGKGGHCTGPTTLPFDVLFVSKFWEPQRPGALWASPGQYRDCSAFTNFNNFNYILEKLITNFTMVS